MPSREKPYISETTMTRRTLLEWVGKAAVIPLGVAVLRACASRREMPAEVPPGADAGADAPDETAGDTEEPAGAKYPFEPGKTDKEVFEGWGERTVDEQDIGDILATWKLKVDGLVEEPLVLTFAELVGLPATEQTTDFHCVEGWSIHDVPWNGVHLQRLFETARPKQAATHVTFHTIGGEYNESLPVGIALEPRSILAYGIGGSTLPLKHGFPVRFVVPRLLAYKNPKYVERIELADRPVDGYWVARGYPYAGEVPSSRLRPGKY